jgi:glutathione S-transferase
MSIVFYYAPMSSSTRVHWALEELGVPYEKKKVDLAAGEQRKADYLSLNPNGKVPLLVDEGVLIFESLAILIYLGERYGVEKNLFPSANMQRAEALKWMAWGSVTVTEALSRLIRSAGDRFPDEKNEKNAATAKKDLGDLIAILDRHLAGKEYVLGGGFSLADVALAAFMPFLGRLGVDFNPFTHVNAWVGRCTSRPALGRAMTG